MYQESWNRKWDNLSLHMSALNTKMIKSYLLKITTTLMGPNESSNFFREPEPIFVQRLLAIPLRAYNSAFMYLGFPSCWENDEI